LYYRDFRQISDKEVIGLLQEFSAQEIPAAIPHPNIAPDRTLKSNKRKQRIRG
jgi:hypothetical protein